MFPESTQATQWMFSSAEVDSSDLVLCKFSRIMNMDVAVYGRSLHQGMAQLAQYKLGKQYLFSQYQAINLLRARTHQGFIDRFVLGHAHIFFKTYWPAGGGRGRNPENTAQGNSVQNPICP